jgi:hypothetical protein
MLTDKEILKKELRDLLTTQKAYEFVMAENKILIDEILLKLNSYRPKLILSDDEEEEAYKEFLFQDSLFCRMNKSYHF